MAFDITAGTEMYVNFSRKHDEWRDFFIKYQDRLIFGTDSCDVYNEKDQEIHNILNNMEKDFLTKTGEISLWDLEVRGMGFDESIQNKIFTENFLRYVNDNPNPLNDAAVLNEIEEMDKIIRDSEVLEKLNTYKGYFL